MPETLLGSGSIFDGAKVELGHWLRENAGHVRALPPAVLSGYVDHRFAVGWSVEVQHGGAAIPLHVLIDGQFPYAPLRVALTSGDAYLRWPHVEAGGVLCLPRRSAPAAGVESAIGVAIADALALVDQCRDPKYVEDELRREFVSYWNRSDHDKAKPIRSLLNLADKSARRTAVWFGKHFTMAGETPEQVRLWLKNFGRTDPSTIVAGVFAHLDQAPVPPYPARPGEAVMLLEQHCPEALLLFDDLPLDQEIAVVFAAGSPAGIGLIGALITEPGLNGFRKGVGTSVATKMTLWKSRSQLQRSQVERFDAAWVHGRGLNEQQPRLEAASVLVLGCGSLGSQVAVRLAQSGVGAMHLADPQLLGAANVGRHALGMTSVGRFKAVELAGELRRRFPHMREVEGYALSWQELRERHAEVFDGTTLIVACLGEWGADGQLGEWHAGEGEGRPVVYGWLDERGTAAHALALVGAKPALSCVLNADGALRIPETEWPNDGLVQAEPACGTLFQPYGAIDVARAEALVARLCVDLLADMSVAPEHRVYAGSTTQIAGAGGTWSPAHLQFRPRGFDAAFEYERPIAACGDCPVCRRTP